MDCFLCGKAAKETREFMNQGVVGEYYTCDKCYESWAI